MNDAKSSISQAETYQAIGEFWDAHDLADYWDQTAEADLRVNLRLETVYYPVDRELAVRLAEAARRRGISPETLLNLWVQEKLLETPSIE